MILCHCARLDSQTLHAAAARMAGAGVTPSVPRLFRACGAQPSCGACFPLLRDVARAHATDRTVQASAPTHQVLTFHHAP